MCVSAQIPFEIDGKEYSFNDYQAFEKFFLEKWIGEVEPWEENDDETLERWIEIAEDCDGIPLGEDDEDA